MVKIKNEKDKLVKKALLLEYFTIGWNFLEGIISIWLGVIAGSIALVGFGFDSYIELISGSVLVWRLKKHGKAVDKEEKAEKRAIFIVGITFILLAIYVIFESFKKLMLHEMPETSMWGIVLVTISLIIMPFLGFSKKNIAEKIKSRALRADSLQTLACSYLSLTILLGLGLNALFGWWWADPSAALIVVIFLVKEGREAIKEGSQPCRGMSR